MENGKLIGPEVKRTDVLGAESLCAEEMFTTKRNVFYVTKILRKVLKMTNKERLEKLDRACELIREVEFSYSSKDIIRKELYSIVVRTFSWGGGISIIKEWIREEMDKEAHGVAKQGYGNE
jgi:hypothetical protein